MICLNCHKEIDDDSNFCNYCGTKVVKANACPNCGAENLPKDSLFCPDCGCKLHINSSLVVQNKELGITVNNISFKMIRVESGAFIMGATAEMEDCVGKAEIQQWIQQLLCSIGMPVSQDDPIAKEQPIHQVTLTNSYYIGETEVTQALWKAVMNNNPSNFQGENLPVENIRSWECREFIYKLNTITGLKFRLPTEAEWEFAARGGNNSNHYRYSGSNNIDDVAWYKGNSENTTHAVATKQPNELGIYDMSGNVMELCADNFENYSNPPKINPICRNSKRTYVVRGGAYDSFSWDCRSSCRYRDKIHKSIGLRLALSM